MRPRISFYVSHRMEKNNKSCPMCRTNLDVGQDLFGMQDMPDDEFDKLKTFFGIK